MPSLIYRPIAMRSPNVEGLPAGWSARGMFSIVSESAHEDFHPNLVVNLLPLSGDESLEAILESSQQEVSAQGFPEFRQGKTHPSYELGFGSGAVAGARFDFTHSAPHPAKPQTMVPLRRASLVANLEGTAIRITFSCHRGQPEPEQLLTMLLQSLRF